MSENIVTTQGAKKNVLITGATSGIGLQLATDYANLGWHVFGCGRNIENLKSIAEITPLKFDVTDKDQVKNSAKNLQQDNANIQFDLVILNAGDCKYINDPVNFDDDKFEYVIRTNLLSVGYCLHAFLPLIKQHGRIAFMGSSASFLPLPRAEAYGASKIAIQYLANSLRIDLAAKNIYVSTIFPGFVKTPLTDKNDFPMPLCINVTEASQRIIKQLDIGKDNIHFPKRLTLTMKFISLLPDKLWKAIALRLLKK